MEWIDFKPLAKFDDVQGKTRNIRGCSLVGRDYFLELVWHIQNQLKKADPAESFEEAYWRDSKLQECCKTALKLNGIKPKWVNVGMLVPLLLHRGDNQPGWLVELNQPKKADFDAGEGLSTDEVIALLSISHGLTEALKLATSMPAERLLSIVRARAEIENPKAKQDRVKKENLKKLRKSFDELLASDGEEMSEIPWQVNP